MRIRASILAGPLLAAASGAFAQHAPAAFAASNLGPQGSAAMAAACAPCHGTRGLPVAGSPVEALAARPAAEIIRSMAQFKAGSRPATVMHQIAKGYTEGEIAAMAAYFAAQKR